MNLPVALCSSAKKKFLLAAVLLPSTNASFSIIIRLALTFVGGRMRQMIGPVGNLAF